MSVATKRKPEAGVCTWCEEVKEHGAPLGPIEKVHCRDCHFEWPMESAQAHCAGCHRHFENDKAFDNHQCKAEVPEEVTPSSVESYSYKYHKEAPGLYRVSVETGNGTVQIGWVTNIGPDRWKATNAKKKQVGGDHFYSRKQATQELWATR